MGWGFFKIHFLVMPIFTTVAAGAGAAKAAGVNFSDVTGAIGGVFGGGKSSYRDKKRREAAGSLFNTLESYGEWSTAKSRQIERELVQAARSGASDRQIAQIITNAGGFGFNEVLESWRYPIILSWLEDEKAANSYQNDVNSASRNSGSGGAAGGGSGIDQNVILWGAAGLVGVLLLTRL